MSCANCGAELPDDANYCWRCGQAQNPGAEGSEAAWEDCELFYSVDCGVLITCRLWARAVGPEGEYNAGESEAWVARYPAPDCPEAIAARAGLVRRLVVDGWEHVGTGLPWFNDRFRRRL